MENIEYRARPVTRWIVTRYCQNDQGSDCRQLGEYDNANVAYEVGYALARAEHERLGWSVGDERMHYPDRPTAGGITIA